MEQWTGLKLGKEYIKAVYDHSAYLTCMQSTSCGNARLDESQAGVKIIGRNINSLRYSADTTLMGASLEARTVKKNLSALRETWVRSWVGKILWRRAWILNILAWRIPRTEEPGGL